MCFRGLRETYVGSSPLFSSDSFLKRSKLQWLSFREGSMFSHQLVTIFLLVLNANGKSNIIIKMTVR